MATIYQVDAFTDQLFKGNPAGVMLLENGFLEKDLMQNIVKEMNVSEVAFVVPREKEFDIRFFTPKAEVPLCGHATLSAAHILFETEYVSSSETIRFNAMKDVLEIELIGGKLQMKFPEYELRPISILTADQNLLNINVEEAFGVTNNWKLLVLSSEEELQKFVPQAKQLQDLGLGQSIFTAASNTSERDIVCRCFVPDLGILEDPVTGSAHCALGVYWSKKLNKFSLKSEQISERKGQLQLEMKQGSVFILGEAKTVFEAELYL
jgi:PhzF family phenazine biosynthesis protein